MSRCSINLGRDFILSAVKRRRIYRAMQIYLTLCIPLFCIVAYASFLNLQNAVSCRHSDIIVRTQFSAVTGGAKSLLHHADQLRKNIETCAMQAQSIRQALPPVTHTVLPILAFVISQSDNSTTLSRMALVKDKNGASSLEFSLTLSDSRKSHGQNFFRNWQTDPELAGRFSSITPVTTRLGDSDDSAAVIVNYRAVFKELP